MPNDEDLGTYRLEEVRRIMRKQLAAWCNPKKLTAEEIAAVNEIVACSAAARYPNVAAVLNRVDLGEALEGNTVSGTSAENIFVACVIETCHRIGIEVKTTDWPDSLAGWTIETLSAEVLS